jgi:hypothetical protein
MNTVPTFQAAQNLDDLIEQIIKDEEPIILLNKEERKAVLMSLDEFNSCHKKNRNKIMSEEKMWTTEEDDKKNWEGWLVTTPRIERIIKIRHAVTKLWQNCEERYPPLPYYTPHGPAHARSVEDILHRLLPGESYKKLKEIERYYLLAAAWTHDIGMIRGINDKEDAKLHPDQIREEHHKRSENYIVNNYLMIDIEKKDSHALGLLAFFHRKRENIEDCPETFVVGTEMVRLKLLAAYLRLADALDVDQSRAPSSDYAICLAYNIPFTSKLHWIKSRLVSGIAALPNEQRIHVNFKKPHEEDLKKFYLNKNKNNHDYEEYNPEMIKRNLDHLQKNVLKDIRKELDSIKTVLIRGEITCYLDVTSESIGMVIDDQVLPEIIRLADDLDMIVHPSATRLILLLLDTVRHIIDRYFSPPDKGDRCKPDDCNSDTCKNSPICQMPKLVKKEVKEFITEIQEQVLKKRKCHLGLQRIVERLDDATSKNVSDVKRVVDFWRNEIEEERRKIRLYAYTYFKEQVDIDEKCKDEWKFIEDRIKTAIQQVISTEKPDEDKDGDKDRYVTILLYGYSELVIKALSGFRDAVIQKVITSLHDQFVNAKNENDEHKLKFINNLHKINMEEIASHVFRIFVCEGQPKTITAQNDTLQHHDGTRFSIALGRKGFKNVIIIPDLVAGRLLSGASLNSKEKSNRKSHIDFVLLGVNGLKLYTDAHTDNIFLHSSGHISLAKLKESTG